MINNFTAIGCAIAGGAVGYAAFFWVSEQGFYGMILPGGLLGLAAGIVQTRTVAVPLLCGFLALFFGIFTEYRAAPFIADGSFSYFLAHLGSLRPMTMLMIALGGVIGFWVPFRRRRT